MHDLSEKIVIVSGGATLIGEKVAKAFAESGAKVVIADINDADGAKVAEQLGANVSFIKTDITNDADIDRCLSAAVAAHGGIDYLINVACTYLDNGADSSREEWLQVPCWFFQDLAVATAFARALVPRKLTSMMRRSTSGPVSRTRER